MGEDKAIRFLQLTLLAMAVAFAAAVTAGSIAALCGVPDPKPLFVAGATGGGVFLVGTLVNAWLAWRAK